MEGEGQVVVFLGTEVVGAKGMAQVGRAEEVVARPTEKLREGKPRWQTSNPGKD